MQNGMNLQEMLDKLLRTIFAQDMTRRPVHRNNGNSRPGPYGARSRARKSIAARGSATSAACQASAKQKSCAIRSRCSKQPDRLFQMR